MSQVSLKSLLVPSKSVEVEFPGMPGFVLSLAFLSREALVNMRKKATKVTLKQRQTTEELNEELFLQMYTDAAIKGWKGLKFSYLELLAPVDVSAQNPEDFLEFTAENALYLMKHSGDFDQFVSVTVSDLANFSTNSSKS